MGANSATKLHGETEVSHLKPRVNCGGPGDLPMTYHAVPDTAGSGGIAHARDLARAT